MFTENNAVFIIKILDKISYYVPGIFYLKINIFYFCTTFECRAAYITTHMHILQLITLLELQNQLENWNDPQN